VEGDRSGRILNDAGFRPQSLGRVTAVDPDVFYEQGVLGQGGLTFYGWKGLEQCFNSVTDVYPALKFLRWIEEVTHPILQSFFGKDFTLPMHVLPGLFSPSDYVLVGGIRLNHTLKEFTVSVLIQGETLLGSEIVNARAPSRITRGVLNSDGEINGRVPGRCTYVQFISLINPIERNKKSHGFHPSNSPTGFK